MKKLSLLVLLLLSAFALSACGDKEPEVTTFTVTFNADGGTAVDSQTVDEGLVATEPTDPTKEGYVFQYWYATDDTVEFVFTTPVTADLTLTAKWEEAVPVITDEDLVNEDIADYLENMYVSTNLLYLPKDGDINGSDIDWEIDTQYISEEGIILPLPSDVDSLTVSYVGTFSYGDYEVDYTFDVPLAHPGPVALSTVRALPFENLTTEYEVADGTVNMYYEDGGYVPYIKIADFFTLLDGFVDPDLDITFTLESDTLTISYQYYDDEEDVWYDMIVTLDATDNTVTTNDPAFYWAYVSSTETNYGRHILYDWDNPNASFDEGDDIVYDLDDYNMDIVVYEGDIVMPFYMVNQLFAGLSYFNVYYNYDGLYGIYSLPDDGSREMRTIRTSSMNGDDIPVDLLIHTFNMLAFNLDNLYGLKDIMGVDTYYDLLYDRKDDLLVTDPEDFEDAIRDLLLQDLDEPHTSYGYHSYFNTARYEGPVTNSLSVYGTRFTQWYYDGLVAVDDVIAERWDISTSGWAASDPKRPLYWFLDDTTVILSLDDFYTADIEESAAFDLSIAEKVLGLDDASGLLPTIAEGSKFFYYNNSTETRDILEIMVKGASESYVATYQQALVALGFTEYQDAATTDERKVDGYYTKTLTEGDYMVQVTYDAEYDVLYVGVIDSVPTDFTSTWPLYADVEGLIFSDSAVYMEFMMDAILEEQPLLEDIILDLSWNTGGNIGALYRIVGFITDDPFEVSGIDGDTGGSSTYYVTIPGIDAYDQLNWALLVTPVTFSAANEMATIFMSNDLGPIIGVQTGGGACSITPILLPNGTAFTMSSNNISAYRTGSGTEADPYVYHNTEFGITPDYEIDIDLIYDTTTLLNILNQQ